MKKILLLNTLLLLFFIPEAKCDRIIFNGDTLTINAKSLLSEYPGFKSLRSKLISYQNGCYNAEWTITGHQLYLTNIYSCLESKPPVKENINATFHVTNGKVKASWVTKKFWFPVGKPLHSSSNNYINIYKAETQVSVVNGKLVLAKRFNYTHSRESIYNNDPDALSKFVAAHINRHNIPHQGQPLKVGFMLRTGASGKAEIVSRLYGTSGAAPHSPLYEAETKRIIKLLPMGIYYRHGKLFRENLRLLVEFNNDKRFVYKRPE